MTYITDFGEMYHIERTGSGSPTRSQINASSPDATLSVANEALRLDSTNQPHVIYVSGSSLWYASLSGGVWSTKEVKTSAGGADPVGPAFTFGAMGRTPVVASNQLNAAQIDVYYKSGSTWLVDAVDTNIGMRAVSNVDIEVGPGNPQTFHLVYYDSSDKDLKYARSSGTWSVSTIASQGTVGLEAELEVDAQGELHVVHYDVSRRQLMYMRYDGTQWLQ